MQQTRDDQWKRGHTAARDLHDALLAIGLPETELVTLTARDDATGAPRIHVPSLSPESVDLILVALSPYLGPAFVGRRDAPPIRPGA